MNATIEVENITNFFVSVSECESENENEIDPTVKQNNTKIIQYGFNAINEANISDKIKQLLYYSNHFSVVEEYCFINVKQIDETIMYSPDVKNNNVPKHLLFKYKNERMIDLNSYLFNLPDPTMFIFHTIESFMHILKGLIILNTNDICFFNLSSANIAFNLDCGEKAILHNFQSCLQVDKLNNTFITNIITDINDYTYKPLEVHILFYLIKNNLSTISSSFIEEISEMFVANLSILTLFSKTYKDSYKVACVTSLKKYINKSKLYIINDILEQTDKWDVYSLSVLYLHIFGNISNIFSLSKTVISKITLELSKNIHPDPLKRSGLETVLEKCNALLLNETDWSFVKRLPSNKMTTLFHILSK